MQGFAAALLSTAVAASTPSFGAPLRDASAFPVAEAYVAELDADWNVAREIRVPCPVESGCAVDLGLGDGDLKAVHVRFDRVNAGQVAVTSRLEGAAGDASPAHGETLAVDRSGFGASHYAIERSRPGAAGGIIVVAVRVPGWTGTGTGAGAPGADHI